MCFWDILARASQLSLAFLLSPGHDSSFDFTVHEESVQCAVLSDTVPLVISRQLLQAFTNEIKQKLSRDVHKDVATL